MGSPTRASLLVLGVALSGAVLGACQPGTGVAAPSSSPPSKASSSAIVVPALTGSYTSAVYGFSIGYPEYFTVRPATRRLDGAEPPWIDSVGVDQFNAAATMVIGSGNLASGMDLDGWTGKTAHEVCGEPATTEANVIGGEPGRLLTYPGCNGYFHLWATTAHGPAGYHLVWVQESGSEGEARQLFDAILATFEFGEPPPSPS